MNAADKPLIFLVDDHPLVRSALAHLLAGAGYELAGQAGSCPETLAHPGLADSRLAVVDLALGEESGLELVKKLSSQGRSVLVYSMHEGSNVIRQALDAGAGGYVTKRESAQALLDGIRTVLAGGRYLSPRVQEIIKELEPLDGLSGQQQQIYRLFGRGLANEEIARQLGISVRTLESYCARIMDKLRLDGMKELRRQAIRDAGGSRPGTGPAIGFPG